MLRLSVVDTNHYMTSLYGGELGTRTLTLIARASKTRMATNYINSPLIFVLVPPVIFEMTTFRSSGECSYHMSYRGIIWYPQNDLNVHCWFRRPGVYPLAYKGIFGVPRGNRTLMPKRQSLNLMCMPVSPPGHIFGWDGWIQTNEMRQSKCRALSLGYISIWSRIEDLNLRLSLSRSQSGCNYQAMLRPNKWLFGLFINQVVIPIRS